MSWSRRDMTPSALVPDLRAASFALDEQNLLISELVPLQRLWSPS